MSPLPALPEKELQAVVVEALQYGHWLLYHTYDSRRSQPGFPDIVAIHAPTARLLVLELKSDRGKVSKAQSVWLAGWTRMETVCGSDRIRVGVLRPAHLQRVLIWIGQKEWKGTEYEHLPID